MKIKKPPQSNLHGHFGPAVFLRRENPSPAVPLKLKTAVFHSFFGFPQTLCLHAAIRASLPVHPHRMHTRHTGSEAIINATIRTRLAPTAVSLWGRIFPLLFFCVTSSSQPLNQNYYTIFCWCCQEKTGNFVHALVHALRKRANISLRAFSKREPNI